MRRAYEQMAQLNPWGEQVHSRMERSDTLYGIPPATVYLDEANGIDRVIKQKLKKQTTKTRESDMSRAYGSYTVGDLIRLNYSFLKKNASVELIAQIEEQFKYLRLLATGNLAITNMKYIEHFTDSGDRAKPITDKGALNKIIFEYTQALIPKIDIGDMLDSKFAEINKDFNINSLTAKISGIETSISNAENELAYCNREITSYEASVLDNLDDAQAHSKKLVELDAELEAIKEKVAADTSSESLITTQIKSIHSVGSWHLLSVKHQADSNLQLNFISTNRITCKYYNPIAGIDKSVDFGYVRAACTYTTSGNIRSFYLLPFIDSLAPKNRSGYRRCWHPHATTGSVCWGSHSSKASRLMSEGNLRQLLNISTELLSVYSPNNPYARFGSFTKDRNNRYTDEHAVTENIDTVSLKVLDALGIDTSEHLSPLSRTYQKIKELRNISNKVSATYFRNRAGSPKEATLYVDRYDRKISVDVYALDNTPLGIRDLLYTEIDGYTRYIDKDMNVFSRISGLYKNVGKITEIKQYEEPNEANYESPEETEKRESSNEGEEALF